MGSEPMTWASDDASVGLGLGSKSRDVLGLQGPGNRSVRRQTQAGIRPAQDCSRFSRARGTTDLEGATPELCSNKWFCFEPYPASTVWVCMP